MARRRRRKFIQVWNPRLRITRNGVRVSRPRVRIGGRHVGVNVSQSGISGSVNTPAGSFNTKRGCSIALPCCAIYPLGLVGLGFVLLLFISGCAPGAAALEATVVAQVEENIVQTVAAQPTVTPQPTYTAEPSHTIQSTHTTQPTLTSRPTLTPEATYTPLPTYTPRPTHTPQPTDTPLPINTPTPTPVVPTTSPTEQFTSAGVALTISYMQQFPGSFVRCTIFSGSSCLNTDYSLDCVQFVYNYNSLVARQNLAPQNAEEPIRTAAAIYTATIQEYIEILTPAATICQEQINLGRTEIDSREIGDTNANRRYALLSQMEQVLEILRQVEAGSE